MPSEIDREKLQSLMEIYKRHLEKELGAKIEEQPAKPTTKEYQEFKEEFLPAHMSLYEKLCNMGERLLKIKPDPKKAAAIQEAIDITHLNITPAGAASFSFLAPLFGAVFGSLFFFLVFQSSFFVFLLLIGAILAIKPLGRVPEFIANNWRLKASNQMVLSIFYVVTYMRHTSNLEKAIEFASEHLAPPLSLDLKKVLWDVETEKYSTVKESLDLYLETWKKWNIEFIEAFHLVESSLYEGDESRRLNALDKALDVILDETYEKMLHYAHNLQNPITMLHMLGIILPILGLVILPLVVSFMEGVRWYHLAVIYNLLLTVVVYYIGKNILSKRPTGYGDTDIAEENPELKKYRNILIKIGRQEMQMTPLFVSVFVGVVFFLIGLSPLIFHAVGIPDFGFGGEDLASTCGQKYCFLEYRTSATGQEIGPYGLGAAIASLFIPLSFGIAIGLYYRLKSKNVIKIRERAKQLELEFASALFQLGNRLGDNLPVEIAVGKVADVMEGTVSGNFFRLVSLNIKSLGMSIERAIFDPMHGALASFPSNLIESSMKVLTQAIKKGPLIAAQALTNVSRYIKEIHKVNERLKDLMADVISSMKSQIKFLTPAIAGVVIGITSMITAILGKLSQQLQQVTTSVGGAESAAPTGILGLFGDGVPTYYFQLIVGVYVVQITFILTVIANGVENGSDKLNERYQLGNNLIRSTLLYIFIAGAVMLLFNIIAGRILTATLSA